MRRGLVDERFELARVPAPPQPEVELALAVPGDAAAAALRDWPASRRSRKADLLERLQAGPAPFDEARRLAGGRDAIDRWLADGALVVRDADGHDVRLAPRFRADPAAADAAILSLRRSAAERRSAALIGALLDGPRPEREARAEAGATAADVEALIERGLLRRRAAAGGLCPRPGRSAPPSPCSPPIRPAPTPPSPPPSTMLAAPPAARPTPACFLLRGVTGSGKTEVYLAAAERVRDAGRRDPRARARDRPRAADGRPLPGAHARTRRRAALRPPPR